MSHFRVRNRHYRIVVLCCGVVLAGSSSLHAANTPTIGEQEGATASVHCPNGEYLAGVAVWYDNSMSGLQPYCVRMLPNGQWQRGAHIVSDRKMSDAIFLAKKSAGQLKIGDKKEIDRAVWCKPRGIRLTPTSRYIRDKLFPK